MQEMHKLLAMLVRENIPFEIHSFQLTLNECTWQIASPSKENQIIDAVSHKYTYGGSDGKIEILSELTDDVVGWLTAEEALPYFQKANEEAKRRSETPNA